MWVESCLCLLLYFLNTVPGVVPMTSMLDAVSCVCHCHRDSWCYCFFLDRCCLQSNHRFSHVSSSHDFPSSQHKVVQNFHSFFWSHTIFWHLMSFWLKNHLMCLIMFVWIVTTQHATHKTQPTHNIQHKIHTTHHTTRNTRHHGMWVCECHMQVCVCDVR